MLLPLALALLATPRDYENADWGVRWDLPEGWAPRVQSDDGDQLYVTASPGAESDRLLLSLFVRAAGEHATGDAARAAVVAGLAARDPGSVAVEETATLGGRDLPALRYDLEYGGRTWTLRQHYRVEGGLLYTFQYASWAELFDARAASLAEAWSGFEVVDPSPEVQARHALAALAARCGEEVEFADDWDDAARRARAEGRLVLVAATMYPGFDIQDPWRSTVFTDPDLVALVRTRFVPVAIGRGDRVPFADRERYGMGPATFGAALLVCTPDGDVLSDAGEEVDARLRRVLAEQAPDRDVEPPRDRLARGRFHLERGELDAAARALRGVDGVEACRLRAAVHRRDRRASDALRELERARALAEGAGDAVALVAVDVDAGRVLMRAGRFDEADARLARVLERHADDARAAEAAYLLGALRHRTRGRDAAEGLYRLVVETWPEDRWAWKAAAVLTGHGWALDQGARPDWPPADARAVLQPVDAEPLPVARAGRARERARAWLLERQRPDGSWPTPDDFRQFRPGVPTDFQLATVAMCGRALLADGGRDARRAARAALEWLTAATARARAHGSSAHFMDYEVWSRAYVVWFLAEAVDAGLVDAADVAVDVGAAVGELAAKRQRGGGWSYYVTGDLDGGGAPAHQSISFTTAAVCLSLLAARDAGFDVPADALDGGLGCLERMRNENGTWEYMLRHADESARSSNPPGSAGRGPVCALALARGGRGRDGEVEDALALYAAHRAGFSAERGKALLHTGPDAQGSHYVSFLWSTCAEAAGELPARDCARFREPVLEEVLAGRLADGSFLADPGRGRTLGTAMALHALARLGRRL